MNSTNSTCPNCHSSNPPGYRFCSRCGARLAASPLPETQEVPVVGERKQVTVLFSRVSEYDAMAEKLDPEEIRRLMNLLFTKTVEKICVYGGTIEKLLTDTVMAVFGAPKAHEDDPVRAVRAAMEILRLARSLSPDFEGCTGRELHMKTGISTGLAVTGDVSRKDGREGAVGDTVNLASRLMDLAQADEILVASITSRMIEPYFRLEQRGPVRLKGKTAPITYHRVVSLKPTPSGLKGTSSVRSNLVGRKAEMEILRSALGRLQDGKGSVICLIGDAGTGKTRLLQEFKSVSDPGRIQWIEGHAYSYCRQVPYFPMTDILRRAWGIEEEDSPARLREKIEGRARALVSGDESLAPMIESLFSLASPETEAMDPEQWKKGVRHAIREIIGGMARKVPTLFALEDIHWADPSSLELLRAILSDFRIAAMLVCTYRPHFTLFPSHELAGLGDLYQEIRLGDLSLSEAGDMLLSLLEAKSLPSNLVKFIRNRTEGNPFYLEETVHSLRETGVLAMDNGEWRLTRALGETDVPPTLKALIAARIDRLESRTKCILQEASVIGRAFHFGLLKQVSRMGTELERHIGDLERSDLLRTRSVEPELEFVFKHALTREVAYEGLLMAERREIHERAASAMEILYSDRISEFSEALAYHYQRGKSGHKAVAYLGKSGEKALSRYALEEAHEYFRAAVELFEKGNGRDSAESLVHLLLKWSLTHYFRGDFRGLDRLLRSYLARAEELADGPAKGMFFAWLGWALWHRGRFAESYHFLKRALLLGERTHDRNLAGYACSWLAWACAELGRLGEAVEYGETAQAIWKKGAADPFVGFHSLAALGYARWHMGDRGPTHDAALRLMELNRVRGDFRSKVLGLCCEGWSQMIAGAMDVAGSCLKEAAATSEDPWFTQFSTLALCYAHMVHGDAGETSGLVPGILEYGRRSGAGFLTGPARFFDGMAEFMRGNIRAGSVKMEHQLTTWEAGGCLLRYAECACLAGRAYIRKALSPTGARGTALGVSPALLLGRGEALLSDAAVLLKEMGCRVFLAVCLMELGLLHKACGRRQEAGSFLFRAARLLRECGATIYLRQAEEALASL